MDLEQIKAGLPAFFREMLIQQYGEELAETIMSGYGVRRKVTFRVNTLKASVEELAGLLEANKIAYHGISWCGEAFVLEEADEAVVQKLCAFKEGKIYMQSLSSMLPPVILAPAPGQDILDMAAAPGGKTTQMAALSGNRAHITACEMNTIRAERLKYNIDKQGASCVYVMQKDARTMDDFFSFDKILLDAPCSGSGVLNVTDAHLWKNFTKKLISKSVASQIKLLDKAMKLLKKGQEMVYSTCSVLGCENEDIVKTVLCGGRAELVPIELTGMETIPSLPVSLPGTLCVAPDILYEGFFVAKIKKIR